MKLAGWLALVLVSVGCGGPAAATDASAIDAQASVHRATITNDVFNDPGPGVRLSDGTVLPAGSGDLWIQQRSTVVLYVAPPLGICDVGTAGSNDAVPTDPSACVNSAADSVIVAGNTMGTDQWVGRAWLVFPDTFGSAPAYRVRDATDASRGGAISITLEIAPLP